jgi:prepilin peptidase CpaA
MPGAIDAVKNQFYLIPTVAILTLAIIASITDLTTGRIFNWLTFTMALVALVFSLIEHGLSGVLTPIIAMGVGLLCYGWMFWFGMLGGGDVKLLMAFGAWGDSSFVLEVALLGIMLGGVMAFLMLLFKGKLKNFILRLRRFMFSLMVSEMEFETFKIDHKLTMPFGIPISVAAVWVHFAHPLESLGIHL